MSQRAPPEVIGFGTTTWTPDFTRSSKVLMCFGLPLRTMNATTERATMPLYLLLFHVGATSPSRTRRFMSGSMEKLTTSAPRPWSTALLCCSEAAYDWLNVTSLPAEVAWKPEISLAYAAPGAEEGT